MKASVVKKKILQVELYLDIFVQHTGLNWNDLLRNKIDAEWGCRQSYGKSAVMCVNLIFNQV